MQLTSKLGTFEFGDTTRLSTAKLIRDTVVGRWFNPKKDLAPLRKEQDCYNLILSCGAVLANEEFEIRFNEHIQKQVDKFVLGEKLRELFDLGAMSMKRLHVALQGTTRQTQALISAIEVEKAWDEAVG